MPTTSDAAQDQNLVSKTVFAVNELIRTGGLKRGQSVPSAADFALELGVSRAVVREAFRSLSTLGIIEVENGRRARVGGINETALPLVLDHAVHTNQITIQQICDVRRIVELRTVTLAALHRSPAETAEITRLARAMRMDFYQPSAIMDHDIAFHQAIAKASRNPLFPLLISAFKIVIRQTWQIGWSSRLSERARNDVILCHERIASAIEAQNIREGEAAMTEHFDNLVKTLLTAGVV